MRIQYYLTCICLLLIGAANLQAQTQYIGPNNGDWFTSGNWNNGLPAVGNDALIGGGVTVVVGSPLSVNYTITAFGNISASAAITVASGGTIANSGTLSIASTSSVTNNGTVQNFGTMTFAGTAGFTNETGASFTNGGSFTLQTTLVNRGAITNNGTIDATNGTLQTGGSFDNNQTLTTRSLTVNVGSSFTNNFGATLNITGATGLLQEDGNFTNNGTVNISGTMTVNGNFANNVFLNVLSASVLTVNAGAQLTNAGTLDNLGFVQNYGTFTNGQTLVNKGEVNNFATFNNNNLIDNRLGATFFNRTAGTLGMGFGSKILNAGSVTNQNAINSFGTIENNGSFTNSGTLLNFGGSLLDNNSTFTNNNTVSTNDVVSNDGTFANTGTVNVNGGSVWSNFGIFNNSTSGTVNVVQDFVNKGTGTVTNNGTFRNTVRTRNEGSFTNNAYLHNPGDFTNAAGATLTNTELFYLQAGNLLNAGSFVNSDKTLVDECSTVKNTGSINNTGGNFELHGILFQLGTITGNAVNNQGGFTHTSATSNAPAVCQSGSFGADINGDIKVYANALVALEASDSCANIVYLANGVARPVFHCSDVGIVQNVNLVIRTRLGDSLTCVAQVTPVDLLEPQFNSCPKDQTIFTPNSTVAATWTAPTATDNCTTVTLTTTHTPGSNFPVGITGVTYTAKDAYNNQNQCQFRIDVRQTPPGSNCTGDTAGPTLAGCPSNQTIQQLAPLTVATWSPPTPSDNCKPITLTSTHLPGQGFPVGTTTVTYTAKDGNNNSSTCSFTVTVSTTNPCQNDTQKPNIGNCPSNIWLPTNPAINGAVAIWNAPGASDNCAVTNLTASHVPGTVFPVGTTTVTYTATDAANNAATCNFTITVGPDPCPGDATAPSISGCPANISLLTTGTSATATWTAPTASDPCAPVTVNNNYTPGSSFPLGVTTVTYRFSDKKGNTSTCNFTVTVQNSCAADNTAPVITGCPANITVAASGTNGATATWTPPTATDNCGLSSFIASYQPGANFPIGTTTVVYTAIDLKGNASNCSFNVNVVTAPSCTTNASPINNTTNVNPASVTLSWNAATNASSYDVYLGTANPPTTTVATNVAGTSTTVPNLLSGTLYYWYVLPKNAAGSATGCASSVTNFTTSGGSTGGGGTCSVSLGSITREIWNTNTWNLASIDGFGAPNSTATLTQFALTATENGTNYMDRVRGFLVPATTGNYTFNVTGDDYTELYLSTNANPASKQKIAYHTGYTGQTEYTKYATQTSATIALTAGNVYYIELKHLEGSGSDHFRASWKVPGSTTWATIPGARLSPYADIVTPVAICKNLSLQLPAPGQSVQITGQQVNNGSVPGCGATITSYNVSPTSFSQAGTYTVTLTVTNSFGLTSTCTSTVTVAPAPCTISGAVCEAYVDAGPWQTLSNCAVTVCVGSSLTLSANPNGLPSYKWSGPNGYTATGNGGGDALISNSITAAQAGTYTVTLTDANGCTAIKSIQVTVSNCATCTDNLLVNSGFESGTAGWTWMQNAGTTTTSPYTGSKSLQICSGSGGISQYMPALPGVSYTMKTFAKVSGATASVGLRFYDVNWVELSVPSVAVTATNYAMYTVTAVAPFATAYVETWAWKNTNGCFNADAFCMTSSAGFPACTNNVLANFNPGFESNFTNWDWVDDATISTTNKYAGTKGAQVCTLAGGAGNRINAVPGATYSLQLWAKISGSPNWAGAGMAFYDANWNKIGGDIARGITATDWSLYLIQGVAPINAKYVDFFFWKDSGGCMFVDEFCATTTGGGASCNPTALFVVGSTWLNSGDNWVKNRLESLGFTVTTKSAASAVAADATGRGLVVISSTVNSTDIGNKFTNVTVPIVTWESYILDNLKMTGSVEQSDYGQNSSYHSINITDANHPLAAGLSGNVQVLNWGSWFRWGWTTQAAAAKVAKVSGQEAWYGIFGFDKGAAMQGGFTAPARRVSFFLDDDTPILLTNKGIQLFDAAIEWAVNCHLIADATGGNQNLAAREAEQGETIGKLPEAYIQVFPNPATDKLYLEFSEGYNEAALVRLFDINGKAMKAWEIEATGDPVELQLEGLGSGQYLIWVSQEGKAPVSKRIVIANTK